jgi:hypothetical protein
MLNLHEFTSSELAAMLATPRPAGEYDMIAEEIQIRSAGGSPPMSAEMLEEQVRREKAHEAFMAHRTVLLEASFTEWAEPHEGALSHMYSWQTADFTHVNHGRGCWELLMAYYTYEDIWMAHLRWNDECGDHHEGFLLAQGAFEAVTKAVAELRWIGGTGMRLNDEVTPL